MNVERTAQQRRWKIAAALVLAAASGCTAPTCCIDNYPEVHGLVYGTVRLASNAPAPNLLVLAGDGMGARTDAEGRYRLRAVMHGISASTWPIEVTAYRSGAPGPPIDSVRVLVRVPFYDTPTPSDSVRVDLIVPWNQ